MIEMYDDGSYTSTSRVCRDIYRERGRGGGKGGVEEGGGGGEVMRDKLSLSQARRQKSLH
jgi:hypothetical protein